MVMPTARQVPRTRYAACLKVDYLEQPDRLTTLFRLIWIIPASIIFGLRTALGGQTVVIETGDQVTLTGDKDTQPNNRPRSVQLPGCGHV